jgi:hypothetical protein
MNPRVFWGCLLLVLGFLFLSYSGFTYNRRVKVIEIGPLVATADKRETIPFSPAAGAVALVAGIAVLASRKRA